MRGQSQIELADKLGLSYQQVQKYETGANRIAPDKLFDISRIFGVTPGYFFERLEETGGSGTAAVDIKVIRIATMVARISDEKIIRCLYGLIKALATSDAGDEK
jgi:transcriptional regulator with XRE-family HTH domain